MDEARSRAVRLQLLEAELEKARQESRDATEAFDAIYESNTKFATSAASISLSSLAHAPLMPPGGPRIVVM
jgi:hypothetical protein